MASDFDDRHQAAQELIPQQSAHKAEVASRLRYAATHDQTTVLSSLNTTMQGLRKETIQANRSRYGSNKLTRDKKETFPIRLIKAFLSPFTAILFVLVMVSLYTDIIMAAPGEANPATMMIIMSIIVFSGLLRFTQEERSGNAAEKLLGMVHTTIKVERFGSAAEEIPLSDVVVGDIVHLAAGDMIPADVRILHVKDLFINQAVLTGESEAVEKVATGDEETARNSLAACRNLAFMGTNVVSGTAMAVVVGTGDDTLFGEIAQGLHAKPGKTAFEKGVDSVSWVLIRFMLVMVPIVFFLNGLTKHNWMDAFLFAISVAVGLTPEMLPMLVTACLAKGAVSIAREKTIIKKLDAIQNLGAINILCTDKTGTLTQDKVALQYHFNIQGDEDVRVLRHAFLNSYFQTGLKNLMDIAVIARTHEEEVKEPLLRDLAASYKKVDEVPFDFERRRMSVVVEDQHGETQMITKGAVEEVLSVCSHVEYQGQIEPVTSTLKNILIGKVETLNDSGMRVIAVARKEEHAPVGVFSKTDESDMILIGYLAFLDPPKDSAAQAIAALKTGGVAIKVLTGDNDKVTRNVCKRIGLDVESILRGSDIEAMDDTTLAHVAEKINIFAKLTPQQKARIISVLRSNGHSVGFMGDGVNDIPAMKAADISISVDTAVDIAKETSSVILLEKSLTVLEKGIREGRKTYVNMLKYIKITASSNFGNVFSVLVASAFLPFMPMIPLQLVLLNLIYDFSCTSLPWDNVDKEYLDTPRKWIAGNIGKFMVWMGPISSVFDITTFAILYLFICPEACGGLLFHQITDPAVRANYVVLFHSGWFVESMWTQTLVIHMLRTPKVSFLQSRASFPVVTMTLLGISLVTFLPFTPLARNMGLAALPTLYFCWLAGTILAYVCLISFVKKMFIHRYGELL